MKIQKCVIIFNKTKNLSNRAVIYSDLILKTNIKHFSSIVKDKIQEIKTSKPKQNILIPFSKERKQEKEDFFETIKENELVEPESDSFLEFMKIETKFEGHLENEDFDEKIKSFKENEIEEEFELEFDFEKVLKQSEEDSNLKRDDGDYKFSNKRYKFLNDKVIDFAGIIPPKNFSDYFSSDLKPENLQSHIQKLIGDKTNSLSIIKSKVNQIEFPVYLEFVSEFFRKYQLKNEWTNLMIITFIERLWQDFSLLLLENFEQIINIIDANLDRYADMKLSYLFPHYFKILANEFENDTDNVIFVTCLELFPKIIKIVHNPFSFYRLIRIEILKRKLHLQDKTDKNCFENKLIQENKMSALLSFKFMEFSISNEKKQFFGKNENFIGKLDEYILCAPIEEQLIFQTFKRNPEVLESIIFKKLLKLKKQKSLYFRLIKIADFFKPKEIDAPFLKIKGLICSEYHSFFAKVTLLVNDFRDNNVQKIVGNETDFLKDNFVIVTFNCLTLMTKDPRLYNDIYSLLNQIEKFPKVKAFLLESRKTSVEKMMMLFCAVHHQVFWKTILECRHPKLFLQISQFIVNEKFQTLLLQYYSGDFKDRATQILETAYLELNSTFQKLGLLEKILSLNNKIEFFVKELNLMLMILNIKSFNFHLLKRLFVKAGPMNTSLANLHKVYQELKIRERWDALERIYSNKLKLYEKFYDDNEMFETKG